MISPCQEGKSSPDALGRSANKVFRSLQLAFAPLDGGSSSIENQTSICCLSPAGPPQKIEFVISCQSRNNSMGASGAYAPSLSRLLTRPGRLRAEETLLIFSPTVLRGGAVFVFYYQKVFLAAIDGNQVGHELPRHGQRGAIDVALLLFPVIEHRQVHTVSRRHLGCLDQCRLQMFVALLREWCALDEVRRTILGTAQSTVADGLLDR